MSNSAEALLIFSLLTTYLFTFAVATKRCESDTGGSYTICDDDEYCCSSEYGRADCCRSIGFVGMLVGIIFTIIAIVTGCLCCYCCWKHWSNGFSTTGHSTTATTRRVVTTRRQTIIPQPIAERIMVVKLRAPNQPPSSYNDSNTNNIEPPPPYPSTDSYTNNIEPPPQYPSNDPPPSYTEINI